MFAYRYEAATSYWGRIQFIENNELFLEVRRKMLADQLNVFLEGITETPDSGPKFSVIGVGSNLFSFLGLPTLPDPSLSFS